ncbi:MAG: hypothetical protein JO042_06735, partial [Sinobacteraceae bacterium]|nr:hypothetical protein [Nevskiaceae bacterium]
MAFKGATRVWIGAGTLVVAAVLLTHRLLAAGQAPQAEQASSISGGPASREVAFDRHILVDQFGYRPADVKVAVIRVAVQGYDAGEKFSAGETYQVRRAEDGAVVLSGKLVPWKGGEVQA